MLQDLLEEFHTQGLKVELTSSSNPPLPLFREIAQTCLGAALKMNLPDVKIEISSGLSEHRLLVGIRTPDREVAIALAAELQLLKMQKVIQKSGGALTKAQSRFAIFQIEVLLPT